MIFPGTSSWVAIPLLARTQGQAMWFIRVILDEPATFTSSS